ncbi:S-adenosyl-L-methionine-dependent methyltransferase, partial [Paraphysoderma sedebokerense]
MQPVELQNSNISNTPNFPPAFVNYLLQNDISIDHYSAAESLPRYIRVHPDFAHEIDENVLESQLNRIAVVKKIEWLDGFYSIEGDVKIVNSELYKEGKIFGIDISSAVAVKALGPESDDHVLDLCCAPGAKLLMISNLQETGNRRGQGTVTGVDISKERLSICRSLLKKYKIGNGRLFCADGTSFDIWAPITSALRMHQIKSNLTEPSSAVENPTSSSIVKSPLSISKPFFAPKLLRFDPQFQGSEYLYDKVIVDAECTHDGSIAHILKYGRTWDMDELEKRVWLDSCRLDELETLQRRLIANGFRLLKPGGVMIYSTCSFSRRQNESIVQHFLLEHSDATLEPIPNVDSYPVNRNYGNKHNTADKCNGIDLRHTVRFDPLSSGTSGLFIARIRKIISV